MIVTKNISIKLIEPNKGQIEGLPKNPRIIKGAKFDNLVKSIEENPEMLALRELLVYPHGDKFVVIGGNMRLEALKKIGYKDAPCKIIPQETSVEQLKAYTIKDNSGFGDWDFDLLANEWDAVKLEDWGVDLPIEEGETHSVSKTEELSSLEYKSMYYEPIEKPHITLRDCVDLSKFEKKVKIINDSNLNEAQKDTLRLLAYRFIKIDFQSVADYYYFNASEDEKRVLERLRCVLVDNGQDGFIEDDLLRVLNISWEDEE